MAENYPGQFCPICGADTANPCGCYQDSCAMLNCEHKRCVCGHDECVHPDLSSCINCPPIDYGGCWRFETKPVI